LKTIGHIMC